MNSPRQLGAFQDAMRALETLADVGHDIAGEHRVALDWCRSELDAIEAAARTWAPNSEAVGARAIVLAVLEDYAEALDLIEELKSKKKKRATK